MKLQPGTPREAGLDPSRLDRVYEMLETWAREEKIQGGSLAVTRNGVLVEPRGFGVRKRSEGTDSMPGDAIFLVASVTKPLTATAVMLLVERGLVCLDDSVAAILPEFAGEGRDEIRVRHLLTHTSGLPDMLPENLDLRRRHAPLDEFIKGICRCKLLFEPGTRISYQSMGTAMLGEIVARVTGRPLRSFLEEEIFFSLGMESTALGIREELRERVALVEIPAEQRGTDWHWNTGYWQNLGVPWGGMFSTVEDLLVLLQMFLNGGEYGGSQLLGLQTAQAMVTDQTSRMPRLQEESRREQAWGLGWKMGWCDLSTEDSFGHGGATGTLVGADPRTGLACAIFTTRPGAPLRYVANMINGAVV
jgi:CubicO group peptidase (beta-lactamase class C family)